MRMTRNIFEKLCTDYAYLYIVRLYTSTEEFYKIGITSKETIISRFDAIPYEYDIICLYKHKDSSLTMDLESKLLSLESKYKPNTYFQGESECVTSIDKAIEFLKTLNWIKGLTEHFIEEAKDSKQILKQRLGTSNFSEICKLYAEAITNNMETISLISENNTYELLVEFVDIFGVGKLGAVSYRKHDMQNYIANLMICVESKDVVKHYLNLQKSQFYSLKDIKIRLTSIYEEMGINKKAKASDIEALYKTHKTVKTGVNGYLIVS